MKNRSERLEGDMSIFTLLPIISKVGYTGPIIFHEWSRLSILQSILISNFYGLKDYNAVRIM